MASHDAELEAVEAALNALAFADSDQALEKVVWRLLPGLLAALATPSAAARSKCIETLQHINLRVRASPSIGLPFEPVLAVATEPGASAMTRNVAIQGGYVGRCFARHPAPEGALVKLVHAASMIKGEANRDMLLALALQALRARVALTTGNSNADEAFQAELDRFSEKQLQCLLDYGLGAFRSKTKAQASTPELLALVRLCSEYAGVQKPEHAAKVFPLLLVAAGDTRRDEVSAAGENALKRIDSCDVLLQHDPGLVQILFDLFLDPTADVSVRSLVLAKGLLRAHLSASCYPEVLEVIDESVYKPGIPDRLRSFGMQYVSFVIANGTEAALRDNANHLYKGLLKVIRDDTGGSPSYSHLLRAFAFTSLGELLLRVPTFSAQQMSFIPDLYFSAAQSTIEPGPVRSAAAHALLTLASVFSFHLDGKEEQVGRRDAILRILYTTVGNYDEHASTARAAAVLWSNQCFPFHDSDARLINVIGVGDDRPDVRDAAVVGLLPNRFRTLVMRASHNASSGDDHVEPSFSQKAIDDRPSDELTESKERCDNENFSCRYPEFSEFVACLTARISGSNGLEPLALRPISWASCFRFSRQCVWHLLSKNKTVSNARTAEESLPSEIVGIIKSHVDMKAAFDKLRCFADDFVLGEKTALGSNVECAALHIVLLAAEIDREGISKKFVRHLDSILSKCKRKCASGGGTFAVGLARLCSLAVLSLTDEEALSFLNRLLLVLQPEESGRASGRHKEDDREAAVLCVGNIVACFLAEKEGIEYMQLSRAVGSIARRCLGAVESSLRVRIAACTVISTIAVNHVLPLRFNTADPACRYSLPTRDVVVATLAGILNNDKSEAALVEAASAALGRICVGEPRQCFKTLSINALLEICTFRKEDEIQYTAAESIVRATTGFNFPPPGTGIVADEISHDEELTVFLCRHGEALTARAVVQEGEGEEEKEERSPTSLGQVVHSVTELCGNERPHVRKAACIFLVTFLRLVGSPYASDKSSSYSFRSRNDEAFFREIQSELYKCLPDAQRALTTLLAEKSDIVQQLASRGIAMIYDMSSESEQRELVHTLVRSLTVSRVNAATTVAGDEGSLLDINGLPQASGSSQDVASRSAGTDTGSGAATYKELCSLATDIGQPDLVYRFLDLAGHAALWNSRRGAALAGSALLQNNFAAEQLRPFLKSLVPRLYVYCYDPTDGVRTAMTSILKSISVSSGYGSVGNAVLENFDSVSEHCLACMTSRQWRVREAGSAALRDLLSSRRWEDLHRFMSQYWYVTLRAMDDIKESVRKVAEGTARALSSISVRLCDPSMSGSRTAAAAVSVIVQCLLPAFTHPVREVRILVSETLSNIIRHGGSALKSSVPDIIEFLLEAATELEPVALNYIQFHLDANESEKLETARADVAQMSNAPVIDSLERLSNLVDEENASDVVSKLVRLARMGVGVPTRAATSRFFSSLLTARSVILEPYAPKLMNAAVSAARMESNSSARRAWANCAGLAARVSSPDAVSKLVVLIADLARSDKANERSLASYLALGLWRNSPEIGRKHATEILPFAYMGRFEGDENAKGAASNWKEVWNEGAPSSDSGLRLYADEITVLCATQLANSSQYKVKKSASATLGDLAAAHNSSMNTGVLARAAQALLAALPGHIWDGKEIVLSAIGNIADVAVKSYEMDDGFNQIWIGAGGIDAAVSAILKECVRGKREYRLAAMSALEKMLAGCRDSRDFLGNVIASLSTVWDQYLSGIDGSYNIERVVWETGSDADAVDARNKARKAERAAAIAAVKCVTAAYPSSKNAHTQERNLSYILGAFIRLAGTDRDVRIAALEGISSIVSRTEMLLLQSEASCKDIARACVSATSETRYGAVRSAGYNALLSLTDQLAADRVISLLERSEYSALQNSVISDLSSLSDAVKLKDALKMSL